MRLHETYLGSHCQRKETLDKKQLEVIASMKPILILEYAPSEYQGGEKYRVIKHPLDLKVEQGQIGMDQLKMWIDCNVVPWIIYEREGKKNIFKIYNITNGGR